MDNKSTNYSDVTDLPISCKSAMERMVRVIEEEDAEEEDLKNKTNDSKKTKK